MLKRGGELRLGEKIVLGCLKPLEYMKPSLVVTPCDLLSRAMINNCDTTPTGRSEILDNDTIYRLADSGSSS